MHPSSLLSVETFRARASAASIVLAGVLWSAGASAQSGPMADVICGALSNALAPAAQCYAAVAQDFDARASAYTNQYYALLNRLNADRANLIRECQTIHAFAGQIGIDVRTLPPC